MTSKMAPPAGRASTQAAFREGLADLVHAFPDLVTTVDDLVIDETRSRVAVRWTARGTNRVRFLGVGPTNERIAFRGIEIIEIRDGRIVRRWGDWDISEHVGAGQCQDVPPTPSATARSGESRRRTDSASSVQSVDAPSTGIRVRTR